MISRLRRLKNIDLAYFITFFPLPLFSLSSRKIPDEMGKNCKKCPLPSLIIRPSDMSCPGHHLPFYPP